MFSETCSRFITCNNTVAIFQWKLSQQRSAHCGSTLFWNCLATVVVNLMQTLAFWNWFKLVDNCICEFEAKTLIGDVAIVANSIRANYCHNSFCLCLSYSKYASAWLCNVTWQWTIWCNVIIVATLRWHLNHYRVIIQFT